MGDLEDDLTNDEAMAATHDQIERLLAEKGRELLRSMMQAQASTRSALRPRPARRSVTRCCGPDASFPSSRTRRAGMRARKLTTSS
jgi:hypothetical protein